MAVTLSDKAATHIGNFIAKRGKGVGIRLGVRTSGCSGMAYKLEFADEVLAPQETAPLPTGKLWLLAETLPAPSLLGDICRWLGLGTDEVSLLSEMPSLPAGATSPLLWLTAPDPRWPDALVCPLKPDGAHKRALWQQCRQRHTP